MVTRLEFCLGQFLPPFPGGLRMASQHHEAIHKLLVLVAVDPVCSVLWTGRLLNLWEQLCWPQANPRHLHTAANTLGLIYFQHLLVVCWHVHSSTPPPFRWPSLLHLSVFFSPSSWWSDFDIESLLSSFTFSSEILNSVCLTLFAKSCGVLEIECAALCFRETDWGKDVGKSDEQMRDLGSIRAEVEGLEYLFYLLPWLCGLWSAVQACLDKYTIMLYHLSLQRCTSHTEFKGKHFNWYLDDTSLGTQIDFA